MLWFSKKLLDQFGLIPFLHVKLRRQGTVQTVVCCRSHCFTFHLVFKKKCNWQRKHVSVLGARSPTRLLLSLSTPVDVCYCYHWVSTPVDVCPLDSSPRSSSLMKSVIPRFSKNTPEEAVVLKKKDTSALSSPRNVGKWRYEVSVLKEAEFQNESVYKKKIKDNDNSSKIQVTIAFYISSIFTVQCIIYPFNALFIRTSLLMGVLLNMWPWDDCLNSDSFEA